MKKIKNFFAGIISIGITAVLIDNFKVLVTVLLVLAVLFVIFRLAWRMGTHLGKAVEAKEETSVQHPSPELDNVTVTFSESKTAAKFSTPATIGSSGSMLYDRVGIYRPAGACGPMPEVGQHLSFQLDPNNPYDDQAIRAVYWDSNNQLQIAGYMNRTRLREMIRDWIEREDDLDCWVESNDQKLYVTIEFFR